MSVMRARVAGVGHYLPARVMENAEFESTLDTTDDWIRSRSGIERRHIAAEGELTSDLATEAALAALADAGLEISAIDAVIVATSTADFTFPSVATMVQAKLGMEGGYGFDVQAVCAGFIFAMATANSMIVSGQARRILVIGAETFSRIMDWTDRSTCVLFGDGAGALVLEAAEGTGGTGDRGILSCDLNSDGRHRGILYVDGGVSTQTTGHLRMEGKEVFRHAVEKLAATAHDALGEVGLTGADVDWIVPHQANSTDYQGHGGKDGTWHGPSCGDRPGPRQHLGRIGPPRPVGGKGARPDRGGRSARNGGDRRRSGLGSCRPSLVGRFIRQFRMSGQVIGLTLNPADPMLFAVIGECGDE